MIKDNKLIKILRSMSETQLFAIILIGINNFNAIKGKTWFQKELFLISNNLEPLQEEADFKPDYMGPYSEEAKEALDVLEAYNIVKYSGSSIKLTDLGKGVYNEIIGSFSNEEIEIIRDFKDLLNDMDYYDLLGFIYFTYPEYIDESFVLKEILPRRRNIAYSLFSKNKVSLEKAAEIAGIPIEEFLILIKSKGVAVYSK